MGAVIIAPVETATKQYLDLPAGADDPLSSCAVSADGSWEGRSVTKTVDQIAEVLRQLYFQF